MLALVICVGRYGLVSPSDHVDAVSEQTRAAFDFFRQIKQMRRSTVGHFLLAMAD